MGALGRLSRKIKPQKVHSGRGLLPGRVPAVATPRPVTGFYAGLTPAQQRAILSQARDNDEPVIIPMEITESDLVKRLTIGEIQPSHSMRYQSHDKEFKGRVFNGECNRGACTGWAATWYNAGTFSYYCRSCAWAINDASHRKPLCVEVTENLTHERMNQLYKERV